LADVGNVGLIPEICLQANRQTNKQTHWLSTILRPLAYGLWSNKTSISAYCRLFPIVHLVIDLHCLYQLLYACMQLMWYLSSGSCSQSGASCFWLDFNVKLIQIDAGILTCWQSNACSCFVWATLYTFECKCHLCDVSKVYQHVQGLLQQLNWKELQTIDNDS